ncbi:hypothetical protein ACFLT7_01935 [candidate division KSB1 bacterium]
MGKAKLIVFLGAAGLALTAGCAGRDTLDPQGADIQPLGDPVKQTLSIGDYQIEHSFGGMEYIVVDPSKNYDPAYLQYLKETERNIHYEIYRYADFLWEGLVKNNGGETADSVYVRIRFAGGFIDSAYVTGFRVPSNQTAAYQLYSRGERVDKIDVLWKEPSEEGS